MSVPILHEDDAERLDLPGRQLRWLVSDKPDTIAAKYCSACVIRVPPGRESASGALASATGRRSSSSSAAPAACWWRARFSRSRPAPPSCFRRAPSTCCTTADGEEMKVVCFFAPPTGLENYRMHEDVDFPD